MKITHHHCNIRNSNFSDGLRTKQNNNSPSSHGGDCDLKVKLHLRRTFVHTDAVFLSHQLDSVRINISHTAGPPAEGES